MFYIDGLRPDSRQAKPSTTQFLYLVMCMNVHLFLHQCNMIFVNIMIIPDI